jgi:hypothetical protein
MVKANYPDLLEMVNLAETYGYEVAVIGRSAPEERATLGDTMSFHYLAPAKATGNQRLETDVWTCLQGSRAGCSAVV